LPGLLVALAAISTFACPAAPGPETDGRPGVAVTIATQGDFVRNVGGDKVDVTVMVPPGASPHVYEPTPSQIRALAKARMYAKVGSGVEFELAWLDKLVAANREMLVVDCSRGVQLIETSPENRGHGAFDPHIWMSPLNARIMVQNICDGLVRVDPASEDYYENSRDTYLQSLARLDADIRDGLAKINNRRFLVYHPAFGYFARDYDLTMLPIEEEGKEPTVADLARIIEQARQYNIRVIFASPQFNPESAKVIAAAIGGRVVFVDSVPADYIASLRAFLSELAEALE